MPLFCALAAASSVVDARERRLPNGLLAAMALLALAGQALRAWAPSLLAGLPWFGALDRVLPTPGACVAGAFLSVALLGGLEAAWRRRLGRTGLGLGDVKLVGCWALALGAPGAWLGLVGALALGGLAAWARGRDSFALGPWINGVCGLLACVAPAFPVLLWS